MSVAFRNLTVSPDDPVSEWGVEGMLAAIDRGGLAEWRRMARALERDETGAIAEPLRQALALAEDRGAVAVLTAALEEHERGAAGRIARRVRRAQRGSGQSAGAFAAALGTSASRMSTYRSGEVIPSAALLDRMERLAARRVL